MTDGSPLARNSAVEDYYQARRRGMIQEVMARFTGKPVRLLSYEEIRRNLKAHTVIERGIQDIPLGAIMGSVNRYQDFTAGFFPRKAIAKDRWANVELATLDVGLPPIDVYQIGEVYFVKDGNHRVAVARHLGWKGIQAHVEEVIIRVPFTPGMSPDQLILDSERADFLERTHLPETRPQSNLVLTAAGQYPRLIEHIITYAEAKDLSPGGRIPEAAVAHWYDTVYQPVAQHIEETGILRDFPGRTVGDLYLWTLEHRAALENEIGQAIRSEAAASHLADRFSPRLGRIASRLGKKIKKAVLPKQLETGPSPGQWREAKQAVTPGQRLFSDILVTVSGKADGWTATEQAVEVARREDARLHGLHVLASERMRDTQESQVVEAEFRRRCEEAGVQGNMIFGTGSVSERIYEQSRWNDLVVVNLTYPAPGKPFAALGPGFRSLVQRCPRPLLAVPRRVSNMQRAMLAYDGSPKAREALFIAAYLAGQWGLSLVVITAFENDRVREEVLAEAWQYLETHEIPATYVKAAGPAIQEILISSEEHNCDLHLMGGHGQTPLLSPVLGNTVDQVLREAHKPVLICR